MCEHHRSPSGGRRVGNPRGVTWQGFPPDIATWESEDDLAHTDEVRLYEAGLAEEEEAEEGEADV